MTCQQLRCKLPSYHCCPGYRVANSSVTPSGMEIDLERKTAHDRIFESEEPALKCIISYETDSRLRIKIYNPDKTDRYEVR